MVVRDAAQPRDSEDLLIYMRRPDGEVHASAALHIAMGRTRARVCLTNRRWPKTAWASGPRIDQVKQSLVGKRFAGCETVDGEQRCRILFAAESERLHLEVELFGLRGFWTLTNAAGRMLVLSRLAKRSGQPMRIGGVYAAPGHSPGSRPELASRFPPPILASIDRAYSESDQEEEGSRLFTQAKRRLDKAFRKLRAQIAGLETQRLAMLDAAKLRQRADLLLAFGFAAKKTATELLVENPNQAGEQIRIKLQPGRSIQSQAEALYKKARKYEDGLPIAEERLRQLKAQETQFLAAQARFSATETLDAEHITRELLDLGLETPKARPKPEEARIRKMTKGENLRRAVSTEGYLILIGRNNRQNDRLSTSLARGNDLWFHIGRGQAGSHVLLRLPKGKTASLDSLLDAGTLAVHFSKSRGEPIAEVIYTQAKHVSKPKGLAPGKVLADHAKALRVDLDLPRLERLLNSADEDQQT